MSLLVWLPLNGNLKNQGLSSATIGNGGLTTNTNGKIGSCYTFSGSSYISINQVILPSNTSNWSFSCWFLLTNTTLTNANCLFSERSGRNQNGYTIFIYPSSGLLLIDDGIRWTVTPMTFTANVWYHLTITRNPNGKKLYIDGILKNSTTAVGTTSAINNNGCLIGLALSSTALTTGDQGFNGNLNDVRIYDHTLSDKEVEELAKGLVLHYKFNDKLFINPNLFNLDTARPDNTATTSLEKKNNTLILTSSPVNYGSFVMAVADRLTFTAGVTYTLSGHIKVIAKGTDNYSPILCIRNSSNNILVSKTVSGFESDVTMTWTPSSTIVGYISGINTWNTGSSNTTNAITEFSNIKLEIGSEKTPWIPNENDKLYSVLGYNLLKTYDTSGCNYNTSIPENIESLPSPKYGAGIGSLNATTATMTTTIEGLSAILANGNKYTLACWTRPTGTNNNGWVIQLGSNTCGLWWAKSPTPVRWVWNENDNGKRIIGTPIADDYTNWHHLVTTVDKTSVTAIVAKHYIDGAPAEGYASLTWDGSSLTQPAGNTIKCFLQNADLSDVRLYATCLTDDQVKELYNTSASIDNKGNSYARELVEI